jgi:hypothetical protein
LKKTILLLVIIVNSFSILSQNEYFLNVVHFRPTGELGFVMEPTNSLELGWQGSFSESDMRARVSGTYLFFKPRMSEFPTVTTNFNFVMQSSQRFNHYSQIHLNFGFDYALINTEKFTCFGGFDIIAGCQFLDFDYTSDFSTSSEKSYGALLVGLGGRVGSEYALSDSFALGLNVMRRYYLVTDPLAFLNGNQYNLSLIFTL